MANPYDKSFLNNLIGQQETQRLEFKSSRALLDENSQKRGKFISDQLVPTVSAFLNTDGGQLVIGVEEKDGVAVRFSDGVPRSRISWEQLQSAICDRIQPAVAGYVSVFSVPVATSTNTETGFAFVVDIKPGSTAYQADDKKYYVRRSGQSEAMEDKDVRLRMLAGDKPRLSISLRRRFQMTSIKTFASGVAWDLWLENVGIRTIPRAIIRPILHLAGLSDQQLRMIKAWTPEYRETTFQIPSIDSSGLFPGQSFKIELLFQVSALATSQDDESDAVTMKADVVVYIDDGLPAELRNYDLMADMRPIIESGWKVPESEVCSQ